MTHEELLRLALHGHLLLVGEFRGARAESAGYVDKRTGEAIAYVRCIYLIECVCRGNIDRCLIYQKRADVEDPELVNFPYDRGRRYVFRLEGFKLERGVFSGWIGNRGPELVETPETAVGAPRGAPPPPNLV
jgi:hypothetical protein